MEQEIDLRPYVEAVINRWMWIVGTAILFVLLALGISFIRQPSYEATALVAITNPRQIVQFDPRIQTTDESQPYKAYPELAKSDELLSSLLSEIQPTTPDIITLEDLTDIISVEAGSDPAILRLTVQYENPQKAAEIANQWAALFVGKANQVFGMQGDDQLIYFEQRLSDAAQQLEETEEENIAFQAQNRLAILESELAALEEMQAEQLAKQRQISSVLQDANSLQQQLENLDGGSQVTSADQLAAILLRLRSFSGVPSQEFSPPWQLQINLDESAEADLDQQIDFLIGLNEALLLQQDEIAAKIIDLEPQILSLQQEKQEEEVKASRLERDLEIAEETYTALALQVQEEKITSQNTTSGVRLASQSAVPQKPSGQGRLLLVAIAAILGVFLSVAVIVLRTWWQSH